MHQVEKVLERISQPPPSPAAAKILEITLADNVGARDLAEAITKDQAFTARVLKLVNSAYYGLQQKVTTVSRAVGVLGFDTIKSLALTLFTFGPLPPEKDGIITLRQLWEHSLGCAVGARRLATAVGHSSPEEAFVAGLLHDMGRTLFFQYFRKEFVEAVRTAEETGIGLSQAEIQILGMDHTVAGEVWARKWNLPPVIRHILRHHHEPRSAVKTEDTLTGKTVAIVHVADLYCEARQIGKGGDNGFDPFDETVWAFLGLGEDQCMKLLEPVAEEIEKTKESLGFGTTRKSQKNTTDPPPPLASASAVQKTTLFAKQNTGDLTGPEKLLAKFSGLMEAGKQIAMLAGLDELLPNIVSQVKTLGEGDAAAVLVPQGDSLKVVGSVGLNDLLGQTMPTQGSLAGWVVKSAEPMVVADITKASPSWEKEFFGKAGYLSHLFVPVEWAGNTIAVLSVHSRKGKRWSPQEVTLFNSFVGFVAVALENSRLFEQTKRQAIQLEQDLNERKRAEERLKLTHADLQRSHEELKATQLQLIQAEKLESVGRLAAGVAHEVKNPLEILIMGIEYLSGNLSSPNQETTMVLDDMEYAVRRADSVIRGLLDFSASDELRAHAEELNAVVEGSLRLVNHELRKSHITLIENLSESLPPVILDANKIQQVFVNLFMNAIHAMPDGGTLTVKTYMQPWTENGYNSKLYKADLFRANENVIIAEVEDTGTGIPEEKLGKIFDPFFTTKPTGQGTGLGLTVVSKIIDLHDGMIDIQNRKEGGARVRVIFKAHGGDTDE